MNLRALIVEDDPQLAELAEETVASLGHVAKVASHQTQARQLLAGTDYDYVVLDLSIPLDEGRLARPEHGEHLLREIAESGGPPVIVATACGRTDPQTAVKLMKLGAADFVNKPYDGLLDQKILELLGSTPRPAAEALSPFEGGELTFYPDRVTLAGIEVQQERTLMHDIAAVLQGVPPGGGYDGQGIAVALRGKVVCDGEDVAVAVYRLRNACQRSLMRAGIHCALDDVVVNDRRGGYWFSSKVTVRFTGEEGAQPGAVDPPSATGRQARPALRQAWILRQLSLGTILRSKQATRHLQCSPATIRRDIKELRKQGHVIEFTGSTRDGYFQLLSSAKSV